MNSITEIRGAYGVNYSIRSASSSQRIQPIERSHNIVEATQKPQRRDFPYISSDEIAQQIREGRLDIFA
jgi:hypothetical protein